MDVADQRAIEQRFCFYPEVVAAFAITFCVGNQTVDQFEDVLFAVYVGKRVVVHGLFEVDWSWVGEFYAAEWLETLEVSDEDKADMPTLDQSTSTIPYQDNLYLFLYCIICFL